jgi:hypothetical protein
MAGLMAQAEALEMGGKRDQGFALIAERSL